MLRLLAIRLLAYVPTLIAASIVLFVTINVLPGSAARAALGIDATPQAIARFEAQNGLDLPLPVQYLDWPPQIQAGVLGSPVPNDVSADPDRGPALPYPS